jgi:hypothetical protein
MIPLIGRHKYGFTPPVYITGKGFKITEPAAGKKERREFF